MKSSVDGFQESCNMQVEISVEMRYGGRSSTLGLMITYE